MSMLGTGNATGCIGAAQCTLRDDVEDRRRHGVSDTGYVFQPPFILASFAAGRV
jgi:hypothetical protein